MPEIITFCDSTYDFFLGGKVQLIQPSKGYRAAIDPIFLSASAPVVAGDRVLDVGSGHGTAAICLARRISGCRVTGIEIQPELVELASKNARLNGLSDRVKFYVKDLLTPTSKPQLRAFDHVIANPPFLRIASSKEPTNLTRFIAKTEVAADLRSWISFMLRMLKHKGILTIIHRADRLNEILLLLSGKAGAIKVHPLWPKQNVNAKRVIVSAQKGVKTPMQITPGLVLHQDDGTFTTDANEILHGKKNVI